MGNTMERSALVAYLPLRMSLLLSSKAMELSRKWRRYLRLSSGFTLRVPCLLIHLIFLIVICVGILFLGLMTVEEVNLPSRDQQELQCIDHNQRTTKSILVWSGALRIEVRAFGFEEDSFAKQGCQYTQCQLVQDTAPVRQCPDRFDAVLINFQDEFIVKDPLPERSRSDQRFIFFTQEPPPSLARFYDFSKYEGYFNWTMTYLTDADVPLLYGRTVGRKSSQNITRQLDEILRKKDRNVAWMASNCNAHSRRKRYVKELAKYIDVDVYGRCGNLNCPRGPVHVSDPMCYDVIESKYKFYLSFENSICRDYVTEKLFKILDHYVVPVVYGGADYSRVAPPHSYIDARGFPGPKELAEYLKMLSDNEDLYREYFNWKEDFSVEAGVEHQVRHGFCDLCKKLHQDSTPKWHLNLSASWNVQSQCVQHRMPPTEIATFFVFILVAVNVITCAFVLYLCRGSSTRMSRLIRKIIPSKGRHLPSI